MAQGNGGIIGPVNTVTAAKCIPEKITSFTASGTFAVQCASDGGTRTGSVLVVAGGCSGGSQSSGGGGAGGLRLLSCQSLPTSPVTVTPILEVASFSESLQYSFTAPPSLLSVAPT